MAAPATTRTARRKPVDAFAVPHSHEAEMSALGALLLSERAAIELCSLLDPAEFFVPAHRTIFEAMAFVVRTDRNIDLVILRDELERRSKLKEIGGIEYLVQIAETVPSASNAAFYAGIIRDYAVRRSIEALSSQLAGDSRDFEKPIDEILSAASEKIGKLVTKSWTTKPVKQLWEISIDDEVARGVEVGLPSIENGLSTRGIPLNQLTVVQAGSGQGKTPLMMQMLVHAWKAGHNVCYALFADLDDIEWKRRLVKQICGHSGRIPEDLMASAEFDEGLAVINDPYSDAKFVLYDGDTDGPEGTVESFSAWLKANQPEYNFTVAAVDYIQEMETSSKEPKTENDRVTYIAKRLRRLAKTCNPKMGFIVGSQVTDMGGGQTRTRYGTELFNKAGLVIQITREGKTKTTISVRKNRFGPNFKCEDFEFDERTLTFKDPMGDW